MLRRLHPDQPEGFAFTPANLAWARAQIQKYPEGRQASAVIALLFRAQQQEGWLSRPAIESIADMLGMAYIRVLEVATFYYMFQLQPVGSVAHVQVCGTLSCMLMGAEDLISLCKDRIAPNPHELSPDGRFSWEEVECPGACANAPMAQIGKDYYEDLTVESLGRILDEMGEGRVPTPGPQNGRFSSEPLRGLSSLTEGQGERTAHSASVELALTLGDTIRRIDGSEEPLYTPWIEKGARLTRAAEARALAEAEAAEEPVASEAARAAASADENRVRNIPRDEGDPPGAPAEARAEPGAPVATGAPQTDPPDGATLAMKPVTKPRPPKETVDGIAPRGLSEARGGQPDNLKEIEGIGPVLEKLCHDLGIFHFDQIAAWGPAEVAWMDGNLKGFHGRVSRDRWVAQAKLIVAEGLEAFRLRLENNDY